MFITIYVIVSSAIFALLFYRHIIKLQQRQARDIIRLRLRLQESERQWQGSRNQQQELQELQSKVSALSMRLR